MKRLLWLALLLAAPFRSPAPDTNPCPLSFGTVNNITLTSCVSIPLSVSVDVYCPCTNAITITYSPANGTLIAPGQSTNVTVTASNLDGTITTNFLFTVQASLTQ